MFRLIITEMSVRQYRSGIREGGVFIVIPLLSLEVQRSIIIYYLRKPMNSISRTHPFFSPYSFLNLHLMLPDVEWLTFRLFR